MFRTNNSLTFCWIKILSIHLIYLVCCSSWADPQIDSPVPETIVHAGSHSDNSYTVQLLKLALSQAGGKYQTQALGYFPPRGRDFTMMEQKAGIDIMWGSARHDREARFRVVKIPIFKGLIGWRIPLVMQQNHALFQSTQTFDDLRQYRPGQHFSWTDTRILKDNGITVFEVNTPGSLMDMLISDKFDYFPRAVIEISGEYERSKQRGVVIDKHILLTYPTAFYFYVREDDEALAVNLNDGLEQLISNGEMDRLFEEHFGAVIRQLAIHKRQIFKLNNKHLPDGAPFEREALWLDPNALPASLRQ